MHSKPPATVASNVSTSGKAEQSDMLAERRAWRERFFADSSLKPPAAFMAHIASAKEVKRRLKAAKDKYRMAR